MDNDYTGYDSRIPISDGRDCDASPNRAASERKQDALPSADQTEHNPTLADELRKRIKELEETVACLDRKETRRQRVSIESPDVSPIRSGPRGPTPPVVTLQQAISLERYPSKEYPTWRM